MVNLISDFGQSNFRFWSIQFQILVNLISDLVNLISDLVNPISDLVNPISDLVNPISDLVNLISDLVNPISDLVNPISDLVNPISDFGQSNFRFWSIQFQICSIQFQIWSIQFQIPVNPGPARRAARLPRASQASQSLPGSLGAVARPWQALEALRGPERCCKTEIMFFWRYARGMLSAECC